MNEIHKDFNVKSGGTYGNFCAFKTEKYCTMLGAFNPTMTQNVKYLRYLTTLRYVYVICHFWTPICNVLGYWRHRSICYTSLFTTPLVTTISVYSVLWSSDVVSRSVLWSLLCYFFGDLLRWSLFIVFISVSLLSLFLYLGVSPISVPFSLCLSLSVSVAP
jgi:hypothetical protein